MRCVEAEMLKAGCRAHCIEALSATEAFWLRLGYTVAGERGRGKVPMKREFEKLPRGRVA